ncbi:MAG: glycosyl transferase family 1, partial [Candidatus Marinimicrobia bacterium]|nr:glycosyl transferase family 1 [Candidatus Neomarinimicrobiota bacterium]
MNKISFICAVGLDNFIDPIIAGLSNNYIVRKFIVKTQQEIYNAIDWGDVIWLEWANEVAIIATNYE